MNNIVILTIILWIIAFTLTFYTKSYLYLLLPLCVFIINEILYVSTGLEITPSNDRTALFYDISMIPTKYFGTSPNYSEGYWPDGDYSISGQQAENNKFDRIIELLSAKPGDLILDLGCGTCSMAKYFGTKGITVEGLTISPEQVTNCKSYNIKAYERDFTLFYPDFINKYNHIVMMGSPEHIHDGPSCFKSSYKKHNKHADTILNYYKSYLKQGGNMFFSGLHINAKFTNYFAIYDLERMYGATLFLNTPNYRIFDSAERVGFNVLTKEDHTYDYYMATITDENHFGNAASPFCKTMIMLLIASIIYPPLLFMWIYYVFGLWMYMFDGKYHTRIFTSKPCPSYSYQTNMDLRPWTLWWGVFNKK